MILQRRSAILATVLGIFGLLPATGFAQNAHQPAGEHRDGHETPNSDTKPVHATGEQELLSEEDWPKPVVNLKFGMFILEQLEYRFNEGNDSVRWDAQGWYGGDYNRFWFKTEGERETRDRSAGGGDGEAEPATAGVSVAGSGGSAGGATTPAVVSTGTRIGTARKAIDAGMAGFPGKNDETGGDAELQLLYSRMIARFWDFQVGVRVDHVWGADSDTRFLAVIGVQGLAPYRFEVEPTLFFSEDGDVSARLTATTDVLMTQKLILQPRFETEFASGRAEKFGVGQGLGYVELGLRLRYEMEREIAPYIGINWEKKYGETAEIAREEGGRDTTFAAVAGIRLRF